MFGSLQGLRVASPGKPKMQFMTNKHLFSLANELVVDAALPSTLNFGYQIGSLLALAMIVQIATGIFLAMFYVSSIDLAFYSIEYIMRDVSGGFMIRYLHANGASVIFGFLYLHIYRGLYYGSYQSPSVVVWTVGVVIFLLMMMTAFIGYVLPGGQMSFGAATVITNMLTAIPTIGESIAEGIGGGVILMFGAIAVGFVLPLVNPTPSSSFASVFRKPMVFLVGNVIVLGGLGAAPLATPLILAGQIATITYFAYFLLHIPLLGLLEATLSLAGSLKCQIRHTWTSNSSYMQAWTSYMHPKSPYMHPKSPYMHPKSPYMHPKSPYMQIRKNAKQASHNS